MTNCIYKLFERPLTDNLAKSLGNMIVSGVNNAGRSRAIRDLLDSWLTSARTTVVLQDNVTAEEKTQLLTVVGPYMTGKRLFDLKPSCDASQGVDILTAFDSAHEKAEFIVSLFEMIGELPESLRNKAYRLFSYAMDTMDMLSMSYKLSDLMRIDNRMVAGYVTSSSLDEAEKNRRLRFLNDGGMHASFMDIEFYMAKLEDSGVVKTYSGDNAFFDVMKDGNLVLFTGLAGEEKRNRELLLGSALKVLGMKMERCVAARPCSVFLKNVDFVRKDALEALLQYQASIDCATYLLVEDISRFIEKNGNDILDLTKTFMVFTQGSEGNAAFWSAFFGSRDAQERSFSYTKKRSWFSFSGGISETGGVVAPAGKYNSTTTNMQRVNKPIYRPEIFRELKPYDVMCYLREPLFRRKSRIEE